MAASVLELLSRHNDVLELAVAGILQEEQSTDDVHLVNVDSVV